MDKRIELKKIRYNIKHRLEKEYLIEMLRWENNISCDCIELYIRGYVWAENESLKHQEVKYPFDWWEAFKERWFPRFLLKRYPVKYKKVILDVKKIYPKLKINKQKEVSRLMILRKDLIYNG